MPYRGSSNSTRLYQDNTASTYRGPKRPVIIVTMSSPSHGDPQNPSLGGGLDEDLQNPSLGGGTSSHTTTFDVEAQTPPAENERSESTGKQKTSLQKVEAQTPPAENERSESTGKQKTTLQKVCCYLVPNGEVLWTSCTDISLTQVLFCFKIITGILAILLWLLDEFSYSCKQQK